MVVLIDIEWIGQQTRQPTQWAAARVDESWNVQDVFQTLVCPPDPDCIDWSHMACNGYTREDFLASPPEEACVRDFAGWLREDDALLVWHRDSEAMLKALWERRLSRPMDHPIACANYAVYRLLEHCGEHQKGVYAIATAYGAELHTPEHCAQNDLYALREVLLRLKFTPYALFPKSKPSKPAALPRQTRQERNRQFLARTPYNYVYTPHSGVFHRKSCHLIRNADQLIGSVRYRTACQKRRPCKVCRPTRIEPEPRVSPKKPRQKEEELQQIRLLGGSVVLMHPLKVVGCCHSTLHPGKMTKRIMENHDCLKKQCRFFEKYEDSFYWSEAARKQKEREKVKARRREEKAGQLAEEERLRALREEFQTDIDSIGYEIEVVRVVYEHPDVYKVYYISGNPFADGGLFPNFRERVRQRHPEWRILLRHIQDQTGRFLTVEEFHSRKKA